jgi:glycosyltransferase involved in cell wall biosynthesis
MAGLSHGAPARRILHVIPSMGPGGAERQLVHLSRGLCGAGFETHVAFFNEGPNLALLEGTGARLHLLRSDWNHDPTLLLRLLALARRLQPHVLQTWLTMANILGGVTARAIRVPWVFSEVTLPSSFAGVRKVRFEHWLVRRFAAAVISNSESADAEWRQMLGDRTRRHVIRNPVPLAEFDRMPPADPSQLGLPAGLPLVVYVGRLLPTKGVETLLDAIALANAEHPLAALLLGEGALEEAVRERIRALRLEGRVLAPGFRYDAIAWLKRASLFVSLSHVEGMPNTVVEAMAARCPVVVSDIPPHREILDVASALFVEKDDARAAAAAIVRTLREPQAAAERARQARLRAECWSVEAVTAAWASLYGDLARPARDAAGG